jgi:hypothetical protein
MALGLLHSAAQGSSRGLPALLRLSRSVTSSSTAHQAQPQPQAAEADHDHGVPRWLRELGVIRNDWT